VQDQVTQKDQDERHDLEAPVGRGQQPRDQRRLRGDHQDHAAGGVQKAGHRVQAGQIVGLCGVEAGERAGPGEGSTLGSFAQGGRAGRHGLPLYLVRTVLPCPSYYLVGAGAGVGGRASDFQRTSVLGLI
jgi:hypothetical protein